MLTVATGCANVLIYGLLAWAIVGWLGHRSHARVAGLFVAIASPSVVLEGMQRPNPRMFFSFVHSVQSWD